MTVSGCCRHGYPPISKEKEASWWMQRLLVHRWPPEDMDWPCVANVCIQEFPSAVTHPLEDNWREELCDLCSTSFVVQQVGEFRCGIHLLHRPHSGRPQDQPCERSQPRTPPSHLAWGNEWCCAWWPSSTVALGMPKMSAVSQYRQTAILISWLHLCGFCRGNIRTSTLMVSLESLKAGFRSASEKNVNRLVRSHSLVHISEKEFDPVLKRKIHI